MGGQDWYDANLGSKHSHNGDQRYIERKWSFEWSSLFKRYTVVSIHHCSL